MAIGTTTLNFSIVSSESPANALVPASIPQTLSYLYQLGVGSTGGLADQLWGASRTVGAGANDDLDLYGALLQLFGGNLNAAKVVALGIINTSATTGNILRVGGAASNPTYSGLFGAAADKVVVGPAGAFFWSSPIDPATVTSGTADILRVANPGAAPITYQILAVTRSV